MHHHQQQQQRGHGWWSTLPDECPITLEPLSTLPYPPFELGDGGVSDEREREREHDSGGGGGGGNSRHLFDGLALASYVVSRAVFQNPLTREPLSWEDCVRLDEYLEEHCYGHGAGRDDGDGRQRAHVVGSVGARPGRISVREAYGLRESVRVATATRGGPAHPGGAAASGGGGGASAHEHNHHHHHAALSEVDARRADALRSEAASALQGLFVFGNDRQAAAAARVCNSHGRYSDVLVTEPGLGADRGSVPAAGFSLRRPLPDGPDRREETEGYGEAESGAEAGEATMEVDGLRIIDDDVAVAHASDDAAWREVQDAFPRLLGTQQEQQLDGAGRNDGADGIDDDDPERSALLRRAREVAERTRAQEEERRRLQARGRECLVADAMKRREERIRQREVERERRCKELEQSRTESEEIAKAREEIERWRAAQWEQMTRLTERRRQKEHDQDQKADSEVSGCVEEKCAMSQESSIGQEDKDLAAAAKKAAKRRRARERQKAKKSQEKEEAARMAKAEGMRKKREEAKLKCGTCSVGILDGGFEKFGAKFCSPKCARAAAQPPT